MTQRLCGKPIKKAKNGADRGTCTYKKGHNGAPITCGNGTCYVCGVLLSEDNACLSVVAKRSGSCRGCWKRIMRLHGSHEPKNIQIPGAVHTFSCGCSEVLPEKRGQSNKFALWSTRGWACRVTRILDGSVQAARKYGHQPIDPTLSHSVIRKMMEEPNCERCQQPRSWDDLGAGQTPHLHHDHKSGEIFGFTHPHCNPRAMEIEIDRLKTENALLKTALRCAGIAA
jgi:hypothetical protein